MSKGLSTRSRCLATHGSPSPLCQLSFRRGQRQSVSWARAVILARSPSHVGDGQTHFILGAKLLAAFRLLGPPIYHPGFLDYRCVTLVCFWIAARQGWREGCAFRGYWRGELSPSPSQDVTRKPVALIATRRHLIAAKTHLATRKEVILGQCVKCGTWHISF